MHDSLVVAVAILRCFKGRSQMSNPVERTTRGSKFLAVGSVLACTMAGVLGTNCALMMGMVESIDLFERIMVMLAMGALAGGIVLTVVTMPKLGKRD